MNAIHLSNLVAATSSKESSSEIKVTELKKPGSEKASRIFTRSNGACNKALTMYSRKSVGLSLRDSKYHMNPEGQKLHLIGWVFYLRIMSMFFRSRIDALPIAIPQVSGMDSNDHQAKRAKYHVVFSGTSSKDIDKVASAWKRLVCAERYAEPFFQLYWFKAFVNSFAKGSKSALLTIYDQEELVGILPLMIRRNVFGIIPARTLCSLSNIHSCRFDFIVDTNYQDGITKHAWSALSGDPWWDAIEVLNVPEDGAFHKIMKYAKQDGYPTATWPTLHSPYLNLPQNSTDPFEYCPIKYKNYRKRLKGYRKKLEKLGCLRFVQTNEFSESVFSDFLRLESSGWKGKSGGAIACNPLTVGFYRNALVSAGKAGHVRITSMEIDDRTIAMDLGLLTDNRFYCSPKVAYDEEFSRYSPGHVLNQHVITQLVDDGIQRYDFLGPRAHHKYIWTDSVRKHHNCYIFRPTVRGKACHTFITKFAGQLRRLKYKLFGDPQYPKNKR